MKRRGFIYGWRRGDDSQKQLYVYQNEKWWGVTEDPNEAKVFNSIEDCQVHYQSKHAFPEKYEKYLTNGFVCYFHATTFQMIII